MRGDSLLNILEKMVSLNGKNKQTALCVREVTRWRW